MKENKYSSRKTNSELHEQIKALKQQNIEKDMQLSKIKKEKISLQEDIAQAVDKEKKLRQELNEARVQQSSTINNTMDKVFARGSFGGGGTYAGYVNRHKGAMIVGKVQMQNNFLSMKTMGKGKNQQPQARQSQFKSGPMGMGGQSRVGGKSFITRKSVLGLSNQQMTMVHKLSGASGAVEGIDEADLQGSNSSNSQYGEEVTAEALADLDQLEQDLEDSNEEDNKSN